MNSLLPSAGSASAEVMAMAHDHWREAAHRHDVDLEGFDVHASLVDRLAWAQSRHLQFAALLRRHSTREQRSTMVQIMACLDYAASHGMYVPPEYICVDEGESGRSVRRAGLNRMREILRRKLVSILLVYDVSRLSRVAYRGFQLVQEEVVDEGLRAISVSQNIDTDNVRVWKSQLMLQGMIDGMLLATIANDVSINC